MKTFFALILAGALALITLPVQAQQDETPGEKASDATSKTVEKTKETGHAVAKTTKKEAKKVKDAVTPASKATAMTKDKAQELVRQKYPGSKILMSEQSTVKEKQVWVVTFQRTGSNLSEKVMVDEAGKVSRM